MLYIITDLSLREGGEREEGGEGGETNSVFLSTKFCISQQTRCQFDKMVDRMK